MGKSWDAADPNGYDDRDVSITSGTRSDSAGTGLLLAATGLFRSSNVEIDDVNETGLIPDT